MQMKRANLILIALVLSLTGTAWAGADPIPGVLDQFKTMTEGFSAAMIKQGGLLLAGLAGIQFTINGIKQLIKGEDLLAMTASWIQQMIVVVFFFTVITKSAIWFSYILDQWHGIGAFGAGSGPLDPGAIISMGIALIESIRSAVAAKASAGLMDFMNSAGMAFQLIFLQAFVFAAFLVLAGQLALAMIKGYLWLCVGPILLGFGGLNSTRDIAMNTMKAAISIGISILTCYVIAGIAKAAVPIWNEQIANFTIDNWVPMWNIGYSGAS
jgi:type IV secretion system protein TrbL